MKYLDYCLQKAREIPYVRHQQRHYAIVVDKRGRIVAEAANSYVKTHPQMAKMSSKLGLDKCFCHAEQLALVRARGKGCKLFVARVDSKNRPVYSSPCRVCAELIKESGHIKSVEFTI